MKNFRIYFMHDYKNPEACSKNEEASCLELGEGLLDAFAKSGIIQYMLNKITSSIDINEQDAVKVNGEYTPTGKTKARTILTTFGIDRKEAANTINQLFDRSIDDIRFIHYLDSKSELAKVSFMHTILEITDMLKKGYIFGFEISEWYIPFFINNCNFFIKSQVARNISNSGIVGKCFNWSNTIGGVNDKTIADMLKYIHDNFDSIFKESELEDDIDREVYSTLRININYAYLTHESMIDMLNDVSEDEAKSIISDIQKIGMVISQLDDEKTDQIAKKIQDNEYEGDDGAIDFFEDLFGGIDLLGDE